jgi:hypothetical protein
MMSTAVAPFCIHTISYGAEYRRRYWGLELGTTDAELAQSIGT